MNKFKLMLALLAAPSMVLASCGDDPGVVDDKITSVKVSLAKTTIYEGETTKATANVTAKDGVDSSVTWSSSNTAVATVDAQGNVTAHKKGTAKIIATSNYDKTKKGEKTLTVKEDQGFDPSWIEEGYTYSKTFPVAQIKSFLGSGSYEIVSPSTLEGGCYYLVTETLSGVPYIEIVVDGVVYEDYALDLLDAGFAEDRVYYTSYGIEGVDPTKKYTVSMEAGMDESYEEVAPTFIDFYKSSDVWEDDTLTDDTAWSLSHIAEDSEDYEEIIKSYLAAIPFIKMGAQYEINYVDNSMMRALIEAFGGDPSEYPDQFYICDYTLRDNAFDGYDQILKDAGFEELFDEFGAYYVKDVGIDEFVIYTGFGEGGNTLYCEKNPAILDAWPTEAISSFVSDVIESKYSVPAYDKTAEALYMMALQEDESGAYAEIDVSQAARSEFDAYVNDLVLAGYNVEMSEKEDEYPNFFATKGKIVLEGIFFENYDEASGTYDSDNGMLGFYLYGDDSRHEDPGIYLPESMKAILKDGEFVLPLEVVDLESPVFSAESSEIGVATVEVTTDGVKVTPVASGETTITVTVNDTTYSASTVLTVSEKTLFAEEIDKVNALFADLGAEEPLELPEIPCSNLDGYYDESEGVYQIMIDTTVDPDDYADTLEAAGFEMSVDQYGYPIASKGEWSVSPWDYYGYFILDIYYGSSSSGGQVFDVDDLEDGAEICITCLDVGVGIGAYNGKKNFGSVALGDSFDGCTVFVLEDNGDGTWGLFDEDGNQYGADSGKNIKTEGSGVDFDWIIEIDANGDATLSCAGWVLCYNNNKDTGGVFKTYAESFLESDGLPVQIFFADGNPGGGGGGEVESDEAFIQELICLIFNQETAEYGVDYGYDEGYFTYFIGEDLTADIDELYDFLSMIYECEAYDEDGYYGFYVDSLDGDSYADIYSIEDDGVVYIEIDVYPYY